MHVYSCCPVKIQNQGLSRGFTGYVNLIISHFCPFLEIFYLFLQFFTLESCYIWFTLSLEYPSAYVYSFAPGKIQNLTYLGVANLVLSHIALYLNFFSLQFFTSESCWVRNDVCFQTSTHAVGPFSLRLVFFLRVSHLFNQLSNDIITIYLFNV